MKIWFKIFKNNRMVQDTVKYDSISDTRTHRIFDCIEQACYEFDLGKPIWLKSTVSEFKRHSKARFYQDHFIEAINFDFLEIQILEE